ncbi:unnamed protein product [Calypogeia fissa]
MAALSAVAVVPSSSSTRCVTLSTEMRGQQWGSQMNGEGRVQLRRAVNFATVGTRSVRPQVQMGNKNEGKGVFAPIVVLARSILGAKKFNQLRGKGIALHSQVITEFCKSIGADAKQRQGLIRLAKKNGEKLGFLA